MSKRHLSFLINPLKICRGRQFERDAGEVLSDVRIFQTAHTDGGVMDHDALRIGTLQNNEVVQVPMQHARELQFG